MRSAPAAARNRELILLVLRDSLPSSALVLEIASGTGEHATWFSTALSGLTWQPTDNDPEALRSIAARRDMVGPPNLLPPVWLDPAADTWPVTQADAVVAINMIHVAPWTVTQGLIAGAARVLTPGVRTAVQRYVLKDPDRAIKRVAAWVNLARSVLEAGVICPGIANMPERFGRLALPATARYIEWNSNAVRQAAGQKLVTYWESK